MKEKLRKEIKEKKKGVLIVLPSFFYHLDNCWYEALYCIHNGHPLAATAIYASLVAVVLNSPDIAVSIE